jgi:hypothetical protein
MKAVDFNQFEYVYLEKIQPQLDDGQNFKWKDMNTLLSAYEFWRFQFKASQMPILLSGLEDNEEDENYLSHS